LTRKQRNLFGKSDVLCAFLIKYKIYILTLRYLTFSPLLLFFNSTFHYTPFRFSLACRWEKPAGFGAATGGDNGGWAAVVDPGSGKTYYYNAGTGATSWEVPAGFDASAAAGDVSKFLPLFLHKF
jgi:hypothetical protein